MNRIEVITRTERRRKYSDAAEQDAILREADAPDVTVREVTKRHEISESLIYSWRATRCARYFRSVVIRHSRMHAAAPQAVRLAWYMRLKRLPSAVSIALCALAQIFLPAGQLV
ncbi:MAG: transposase [Sphingomonas bacterium]